MSVDDGLIAVTSVLLTCWGFIRSYAFYKAMARG